MGYIGRTDILIFVIFLIFVLFGFKYDLEKIKIRFLLIPLFIFGLLIPFFLSYQYSRTGRTVDLSFEAINDFIKFEIEFPKYYDQILSFKEKFPWFNYILFFILLPIPSIILRSKSSLIISTNVFFTETITGVKYGTNGYSGILPTLYGESLLVFGPHFYFIHAIIVSFILIVFLNYVSRNKNLRYFYLYLIVYCFTLARGGSEGFFGVLINYTIGYLAFKLFAFLFVPQTLKISYGKNQKNTI